MVPYGLHRRCKGHGMKIEDFQKIKHIEDYFQIKNLKIIRPKQKTKSMST